MNSGKACAERFPDDSLRLLSSRHRILARVRAFFNGRGYLEVDTPLRVRCPGLDAYIEAVPAGHGMYLATSPELQMKRLLIAGCERIYQITHAFRDEEEGRLHSSEFTMLEWYRAGTDYLGMLEETEELLSCLCACEGVQLHLDMPLPRLRVADVYQAHAGWNPCRAWDEDRYFVDWVEKIEPALQALPAVCLMDYPAPLAALARLKPGNARECERFELFIDGVEIANAFTELTGYAENLKRFEDAAACRRALGKVVYPMDEDFLHALTAGMPASGGIALGVDRLIMKLLNLTTIHAAQVFPPAGNR